MPLAVAPGHNKAVSYVRFMPGGRLVSASTDGTLRVWNVAALAAAGSSTSGTAGGADGTAGGEAAWEAACEVVLKGHVNERNFIGLSTSPDCYIACGSETNEVVCYHRALPPPVARYSFSRRGGAGRCGAHGGACGAHGAGGRGDGGCCEGHGRGHGQGGGGAGEGDMGPPHEVHFVSSVCWSKRHGTLLAGNSAGHIKVLQMV